MAISGIQPQGNVVEGSSARTSIDDAAEYLISQIADTGFMPASSQYSFYSPHWFRDSSFCAIALLEYAEHYYDAPDTKLATEAALAARRINLFNCKAIELYVPNMRLAVKLATDDPAMLQLASHVPARVDANGNIFHSENLRAAAGETRTMSDRGELVKDTWLRQHDTLPLVLLSLETEHKISGLDYRKSEFLGRHSRLLANYLGKIYTVPSANAWEINMRWIHAYDVAAIHRAFGTLRYFSRAGALSISEGEIEENTAAYNNGTGKGPIGFLKRHVVGDTLYSDRMPAGEPDLQYGVDSEQMFIFTRFGIGDKEIGEGVTSATMERIYRDRFCGNVLPSRFVNDWYYCGGRWLLLGLEYARYLAQNGSIDRAERIINYVVGKYGNSLPEQELIDPENPHNEVGQEYLKDNGGVPIQKLAWSYGALLSAHVSVEKAKAAPPACRLIGKPARTA